METFNITVIFSLCTHFDCSKIFSRREVSILRVEFVSISHWKLPYFTASSFIDQHNYYNVTSIGPCACVNFSCTISLISPSRNGRSEYKRNSWFHVQMISVCLERRSVLYKSLWYLLARVT